MIHLGPRPDPRRGVRSVGFLLTAAFCLALVDVGSASATGAVQVPANATVALVPARATAAVQVRAASDSRPQLLLILDASGSMKRVGSDGRTAMQAAKASLHTVVDTLPENWNVALRVFGSRVNGHDKPTPAACRDTQLVMPMAPLEAVTLKDAIDATRPLGESPIAHTLATAVAHDFTGRGSRAILLVSDGEESCSPDPCATVRDLQDGGVSVTIDTVGLGVGWLARRQLTCIAEHSSGHYYDSPATSDLAAAIRRALESLSSLAAVHSVTPPTLSGSAPITSPVTSPVTATETGSSALGNSGVALAVVLLVVWVLGSKK